MGWRFSQLLYWLEGPCLAVLGGQEDKDSATIPGWGQALGQTLAQPWSRLTAAGMDHAAEAETEMSPVVGSIFSFLVNEHPTPLIWKLPAEFTYRILTFTEIKCTDAVVAYQSRWEIWQTHFYSGIAGAWLKVLALATVFWNCLTLWSSLHRIASVLWCWKGEDSIYFWNIIK